MVLKGGLAMRQALLASSLFGQNSLALAWNGLFYLPLLVSPERSPLLYQLLIMSASLLGGSCVFFFCRFYYRDINHTATRPLALALWAMTMLTTFFVHQADSWTGLALLLISLLAVLYFRPIIRGRGDLAFIIWAILSGLLIAIGLAVPVLLCNFLVCLGGYLLVHRRLARTAYHFIISCDQTAWPQLSPLLAELETRQVERRQDGSQLNLIYDVSLQEANLDLVERVSAVAGVKKALIVAVSRTARSVRDGQSDDRDKQGS